MIYWPMAMGLALAGAIIWIAVDHAVDNGRVDGGTSLLLLFGIGLAVYIGFITGEDRERVTGGEAGRQARRERRKEELAEYKRRRDGG